MLRQGPIPAFLHGLYEYVLGGFFVAAPFLLDYDADIAVAVSILAGLALLVLAATAPYRPALVHTVPAAIHAVLDLVAAAFLIAAPFLFGYSDEGGPTAVFIVFGVAHLLLAIGTRFLPRAGDA
jgi:hypothetical protein